MSLGNIPPPPLKNHQRKIYLIKYENPGKGNDPYLPVLPSTRINNKIQFIKEEE